MSIKFSGVKVFSATMQRDRDALGDDITAWLRANPGVTVVDKVVTQSSDKAFHCTTITLFYTGEAKVSTSRERDTRAGEKTNGARRLTFAEDRG